MGQLEYMEPTLVKSHGQLAMDIGTLLGDRETADFVFLLPNPNGGHEVEVPGHSLILKARSEYFQTVFGSGMAESIDRRMHITEMPLDVFEHFLEYIYTGTVQLTPAVALYLYNAGDKFLMEDLKRICLQFLWSILDSTCIVELLCHASSIGMEPKFINLLVSYAAGHIGEISQEDFNLLTPDLVISLLQCNSLSAREADILHLVCSWAKHIVERDLQLQSVVLLQSFWRRYSKTKRERGLRPCNTSDISTELGTGGSTCGCPSIHMRVAATDIADTSAEGACHSNDDEQRVADDGSSSSSPRPSNIQFALSCGDDMQRWIDDLPNAISNAMATSFDTTFTPSETSADSACEEVFPSSPQSRVLQRLKRRKLDMLRDLLAQPLRYIRFSLINQRDLAKLAEISKIRIITDAVTEGKVAPDVLSGGRRTSTSFVQLHMVLQRERTEKNFEYNGFKFKIVVVKSDAALGVYLHFQYYTYPQLFVLNAQGISISLVSVHNENKKKTRVLDKKIGLGRFGLGYKAFISAAEFAEYISPHNEAKVEVDFPFYYGRKLPLSAASREDALIPPVTGVPSQPRGTTRFAL